MKLLLISNSGRPYLEHCKPGILSFLGEATRVAFVPCAAFLDPNTYLQKVREALTDAPFDIEMLDAGNRALAILERADAILVGGGNTYRLLKTLKDSNLLSPIRERVKSGIPYVGWSAGANLAGPTILTTNDW